jgi:hypothetical protein
MSPHASASIFSIPRTVTTLIIGTGCPLDVCMLAQNLTERARSELAFKKCAEALQLALCRPWCPCRSGTRALPLWAVKRGENVKQRCDSCHSQASRRLVLSQLVVDAIVLKYSRLANAGGNHAGAVVLLWCSGAWQADQATGPNYRSGLIAAAGTFLAYSALQGPNSVMVRPHPVVWRLVHGIGILYLLGLVFLLFQGKDEARALLKVRAAKIPVHWRCA